MDYAHFMLTEGRKGNENPTVNSPSREAYKKQDADSLEYQPNSNSSFQEQASCTAIALGNIVYLWDALDGSTSELVTVENFVSFGDVHS
ncbi:hypothetical protein DKX38_029316 [Salix brachista]|uniref:Uncharacterized protein n=1 Tax=Salix brachista TaxID=2182728 RepID=A0A5N5IYU7_9ROSI|nr:hypothetical protein DKX38_029316 [Salix brachista]